MRILSSKMRQHLNCRNTRNARVSVREAGKARHSAYLFRLKIFKRGRPVIVFTPEIFDLSVEDHRDTLLLLLKKMARSLSGGNRLIVDFSPTRKLRPAGTLYFLANIESMLARHPGKIKCRFPEDEVVEQLFQHVGLLKKLGKEPRKAITADNVVSWHYATGSDATTSAFKALLVQHEAAMGGLVTRSALYDCMSEAVTNTRKHAYPKSHRNLNNWWMFSQAKDGKLEVAICDLGIGIPKSLLAKPKMSDYLRKLMMIGRPSSHDKVLIQLATSTNRSSTGLDYRGKGLPQMLDFIKESDQGGFRAQSGSGSYTFDAVTKVEKANTFKHRIKGTTVQWMLKLQE